MRLTVALLIPACGPGREAVAIQLEDRGSDHGVVADGGRPTGVRSGWYQCPARFVVGGRHRVYFGGRNFRLIGLAMMALQFGKPLRAKLHESDTPENYHSPHVFLTFSFFTPAEYGFSQTPSRRPAQWLWFGQSSKDDAHDRCLARKCGYGTALASDCSSRSSP